MFTYSAQCTEQQADSFSDKTGAATEGERRWRREPCALLERFCVDFAVYVIKEAIAKLFVT